MASAIGPAAAVVGVLLVAQATRRPQRLTGFGQPAVDGRLLEGRQYRQLETLGQEHELLESQLERTGVAGHVLDEPGLRMDDHDGWFGESP